MEHSYQTPDSTTDPSFEKDVRNVISRILLKAYSQRIKSLELLQISISEADQPPPVKTDLILLINKILIHLRNNPSVFADTQLLVNPWPNCD